MTKAKLDEDESHVQTASYQFSISAMLFLIAAFAFLFGASKWIGSYGFTIGLGLLFASVGNIVRKSNWIRSGLSSAIVISLVLSVSYWQHGRVQTVDHGYAGEAGHLFHRLHEVLRLYHEKFGLYPESMDELGEKLPINYLYEIREIQRKVTYKMTTDKYEVTYLGRDHQVGGTGVNTDCTPDTFSQALNERVSLQRFLFQPAERGGGASILFVAIFGMIAGITLAQIVAVEDGDRRPLSRKAVFVFVVSVGVAIVIGCWLAFVHIAVGQSNH